MCRYRELADRKKNGAISWDKDDDAAMDFVLVEFLESQIEVSVSMVLPIHGVN